MSESVTLHLSNPVQAKPLLTDAWALVRGWLLNGWRVVVVVRPENRSDAQNRLLHSRFNDVAKHVEWAGAKRDADTWKRLLTAAWLRARGESIEILPAVDGHGVDVVFRHTSKLSRRECAELSDFVMAWGDDKDVPWCAASLGREGQPAMREVIDQDTGEIRQEVAA